MISGLYLEMVMTVRVLLLKKWDN